MLRVKIPTFLAILFSLGIFFTAATPARAYGVTMPTTMQMPGLTIDSPLSFSGHVPNHLAYSDVKFGEPTSLLIVNKPQSTQLSDLLAAPAPTASPSPTPDDTPITKASLLTVAPTASPADTPAPQVVVSSNVGGLNADKLFDMVQTHRAAMNLPAFQKDDKVCSVATTRAPMVEEEIDNGHMHSGLKAMNLPYWNTENIITMRTEESAFNWWIHDEVHKEAIEGDYKYSCLACSGNACAEEFTNLQSK